MTENCNESCEGSKDHETSPLAKLSHHRSGKKSASTLDLPIVVLGKHIIVVVDKVTAVPHDHDKSLTKKAKTLETGHPLETENNTLEVTVDLAVVNAATKDKAIKPDCRLVTGALPLDNRKVAHPPDNADEEEHIVDPHKVLTLGSKAKKLNCTDIVADNDNPVPPKGLAAHIKKNDGDEYLMSHTDGKKTLDDACGPKIIEHGRPTHTIDHDLDNERGIPNPHKNGKLKKTVDDADSHNAVAILKGDTPHPHGCEDRTGESHPPNGRKLKKTDEDAMSPA